MIDYLDDLLRQLFSPRIPGLTANQISFGAPDQDFVSVSRERSVRLPGVWRVRRQRPIRRPVVRLE